MSLEKFFYMDEQMALDLKQRITKVDITYIDLSLLYLEEKGKSKRGSQKMEEDREVMLRDLQETVYSSLNVISDKCKIRFNDIEKHHDANFHTSRRNGKKQTCTGVLAGRVKKMKQKYTQCK